MNDVVKARFRGTAAYRKVYDALIEAAKGRGLVTYSWIAQTMGLPKSGHHTSHELGQILAEISQEEHNKGRPMLSALAGNDGGGVGQGFFTLACDLGRMQAKDDKAAFLTVERANVYSKWSPEQ